MGLEDQQPVAHARHPLQRHPRVLEVVEHAEEEHDVEAADRLGRDVVELELDVLDPRAERPPRELEPRSASRSRPGPTRAPATPARRARRPASAPRRSHSKEKNPSQAPTSSTVRPRRSRGRPIQPSLRGDSSRPSVTIPSPRSIVWNQPCAATAARRSSDGVALTRRTLAASRAARRPGCAAGRGSPAATARASTPRGRRCRPATAPTPTAPRGRRRSSPRGAASRRARRARRTTPGASESGSSGPA